MIEVIVCVFPSGIMPDPLPAFIHVRSVRVSGLIAIIAIVILLGRGRLATIGLGTVRRRPWSRWLMLLMMLCKGRDSE
jgi:hypothetical protein